MPTTYQYDRLLSEITDETERKVLAVFVEHSEKRLMREDLIFHVFGRYPKPDEDLVMNTEDRKIRECIERLQRKDWPIISSSGKPGYILTTDVSQAEQYVTEIGARIKNLQAKRDALTRSKGRIPTIIEIKREIASQSRLL